MICLAEFESTETIYGLCAADGVVRYVGRTKYHVTHRLMGHWNKVTQVVNGGPASKGFSERALYAWMISLDRSSVYIKVLESGVSPEIAAEREQFWIDKHREETPDLLNLSCAYSANGKPKSKPLTSAQQAEVLAMFQNGVAEQTIADTLGCTIQKVYRVTSSLKKEDKKKRKRVNRKLREERKQAALLRSPVQAKKRSRDFLVGLGLTSSLNDSSALAAGKSKRIRLRMNDEIWADLLEARSRLVESELYRPLERVDIVWLAILYALESDSIAERYGVDLSPIRPVIEPKTNTGHTANELSVTVTNDTHDRLNQLASESNTPCPNYLRELVRNISTFLIAER